MPSSSAAAPPSIASSAATRTNPAAAKRCATPRSSGVRRRPGSSGAVLLPHREPGVQPAAPVDWSEGLKFHMVTSGIGAAAFLCPSGHRMGLLQDSNPRVSSALIARFGRIGSHESQDHWNDKRTLVALTLDDGRSSRAGNRAFVAASKSTIPDPLVAKTQIAILHLQLVGLWVWCNSGSPFRSPIELEAESVCAFTGGGCSRSSKRSPLLPSADISTGCSTLTR